ncbi:MAG: minor capsid protein [Muribaculaceae bacterium]|nr:minor capsid protein [Muribaculaceae bacterium]
MFNNMMQALYNEKGASLRIEILHDKPIQEFIETHASVLDSSFKQIEMSDIMRRRLQRSDYIFSGLKTFHELNEAFPSLLDENGDRKSFERFLNDVQKINKTYNQSYLRAEYNFASASAEMAARWEQFMEDGDRYYLQYRTAADSKVRPEHAALHGVTLPIDDPFWEQFYPPNGWNCRCSVSQVRKSKFPATPHNEAMALGEVATQRDTRQMFRFNPGKEQKTFPNYNPYSISRCRNCDISKSNLKLGRSFVPDNLFCSACQYIRTCYEQKYKEEFFLYRKAVIKEANNWSKNFGNLESGSLYQTRKSFKRGISHARNIEEVEMFVEINSLISKLKYIRTSPLGENKDMSNPKDIANIQKKIKRGVSKYNVYELNYNNNIWIIKTEVYKNRSEAIYCIHKKNRI